MSETPEKSTLPVTMPPRVNLSESPPIGVQMERVEIWRNRQMMRLQAWNGVLDYHAEMSTIDPDRYSPREIIGLMRDSSEFQADLSTGKIPLVLNAKGRADEEPGMDYAETEAEGDKVFDAIFQEVTAGAPEQVKGVTSREYVPSARKRPLQEPLQAKVRGRPRRSTPPESTDNQVTPEQQVGKDLSGSPAGQKRTVKVRRVVKPSAT
jgi:hypothetical protein